MGVIDFITCFILVLTSTFISYYSSTLSAVFVLLVGSALFSSTILYSMIHNLFGKNQYDLNDSYSLNAFRILYRGILMICISLFYTYYPSFRESRHPSFQPFLWINVGLTVVRILIKECKSFYIPSFLSLFRNPLYSKLKKANSIRFLLGLIYLAIFYLQPFTLSCLLLSGILNANDGSISIFNHLRNNSSFGFHFWILMITFSVFQRSWHDIRGLEIDIYITLIISFSIKSSNTLFYSWWSQQVWVIQLLCIKILRLLLVRIGTKFFFWILLLKHYIVRYLNTFGF